MLGKSKRPTSAAMNGNQQPTKLAQSPRAVHGFLLAALLIAGAGVFFDLGLTEQRLSLQPQHECPAPATGYSKQKANAPTEESSQAHRFAAPHHCTQYQTNQAAENSAEYRTQNNNAVGSGFQVLSVGVDDLRVVSHESSQGGNPDTAPLALAALAGATRRKTAKKKAARKPRAKRKPPTPPNPENSTSTAETTAAGAEALRGRSR